jgi:hypothetical protein
MITRPVDPSNISSKNLHRTVELIRWENQNPKSSYGPPSGYVANENKLHGNHLSFVVWQKKTEPRPGTLHRKSSDTLKEDAASPFPVAKSRRSVGFVRFSSSAYQQCQGRPLLLFFSLLLKSPKRYSNTNIQNIATLMDNM